MNEPPEPSPPRPPPPPPPPPEELDRLLRAADWGDVRARLFAQAFKATRSHERSEELADVVILASWDPDDKPWNPNADPDPATHAMRLMRDLLSDQLKKHKVRAKATNRTTIEILAPRTLEPSAELEAAESRARSEKIFANARAKLSEGLERELLEMSLDGVDKPRDQAEQLGIPIEDIRRARERVKYALRAAIDEEEATS